MNEGTGQRTRRALVLAALTVAKSAAVVWGEDGQTRAE